MYITPEWYKAGNFLRFEGHPVGKGWKQPEVYIHEPLLPKWEVSTLHGHLLLTPEARLKLKDHLHYYHRAIELLPIVHEGVTYSLVNVTYAPNCLNREKSEFRDTGSIRKYEFYPERIYHSLFKLPEEVRVIPFVFEDMERPYASFKWQCEQNKLVGLTWVLIWEADE
jgi:hypothetical protein